MTELNPITTLNAIADTFRFRIVRLLIRRGPHCVNEIAQRLSLHSYNTSKHLGVLRSAGLVETKVVGQKRRYTVAASLRQNISGENEINVGWGVFHFDKPWQFSLMAGDQENGPATVPGVGAAPSGEVGPG